MARASLESINKQIQIIDGKIKNLMDHVKVLREKRQALVDKKDSFAMQEISQILQSKNMSAAQAAEILKNHNM